MSCGISMSHLILLNMTHKVFAIHGVAKAKCSRNTLAQLKVSLQCTAQLPFCMNPQPVFGCSQPKPPSGNQSAPMHNTHNQGPQICGYACATEDRTSTLSKNTPKKHSGNFKDR